MNISIPVNEPLLNGNEKKYLNECIDTGWISSEGSFVKQFEDKFSARVGRKYGVAVCNGSVALDVAVTAIGINKGRRNYNADFYNYFLCRCYYQGRSNSCSSRF